MHAVPSTPFQVKFDYTSLMTKELLIILCKILYIILNGFQSNDFLADKETIILVYLQVTVMNY